MVGILTIPNPGRGGLSPRGKQTIEWGLRLGSNNDVLSANARILIDGKESSEYMTVGNSSNISQIGVTNEGFPEGQPISNDAKIGNQQRTRPHSRSFAISLPEGRHTITMQWCLTHNNTDEKVHTNFWWYSYDRYISVRDD